MIACMHVCVFMCMSVCVCVCRFVNVACMHACVPQGSSCFYLPNVKITSMLHHIYLTIHVSVEDPNSDPHA